MDALAHQHVAARILSGHAASTRTALRPQQCSPMLPSPFARFQKSNMCAESPPPPPPSPALPT